MIDLTASESDAVPRQRVFSAPRPAGLTLLGLIPLADLDVATEADGRDELTRACEVPGDHRWVVVTGVPDWFVDVRGLAVLLDGAAHAIARGRELVVVDAPRSLRQAVTALSLGTQLRLVDSLTELPV